MHQNHIISGLRLDPTALPISPMTSKEVGVLFLLTRAPLQKLDLHSRPVWSRTSTLQRTAIPVLFNLLTLLLASLYRAAWLIRPPIIDWNDCCYCFCCQSFPDRVRRLARPKIRWLSRGNQLRQRLAIDWAVTVWIRPVLWTESQWTAWLLGHTTRSRCGPRYSLTLLMVNWLPATSSPAPAAQVGLI